MLRRQALKLLRPNNLPRPTAGFQGVRDGDVIEWSGYGTFKQQTMSQSTRELGAGTQFMAVARTKGLPISLNIVPGSWKCLGPDGRLYEIANVTRTGHLVTLNLQQAVKQSGNSG